MPALRCCAWRCRAGALGPSRAALDAVYARGRPARVRGWAGAARRGRTVGAQGRGRHRARGAAGVGRLAEPQDSVSAAAAALTPAPPMRRRGGGRVVSARARDVRNWVHVCVHRCVRSSACVCVRTYARMRRMRSSVRVGVYVCACAQRRPSSGYHNAHVYSYMYACAHVHMYACARRMHLSARGRGRGRGRARGRGGSGGSTSCVSLRTLYIDVYLCMNVGTYGCILACL
jgi:hypothetical protein